MAIVATTLRDLIDTKMASKLDTYASGGTTRTTVKTGLLEAIAEAVAELVVEHVDEEIAGIDIPSGSGLVPVTDTDLGGDGISTTSNVAGGGVNTNILLPLETGMYLIVVQGTYITTGAGGPRTQWVAANGLVHDYLVTTSLITFGATSVQNSFALDEAWTQHSGGASTSSPITLTTTVRVTTAGDLRLRLASVNNGFMVTMQETVATALKLA
jgi:hypothetical protein